MRYLLTILLLFSISCTNDFSDARYRRPSIGHTWKRRPVPVIKTGTYRNPLIKKEIRREMLVPKTINLDR
jgi:hypothetical protein